MSSSSKIELLTTGQAAREMGMTLQKVRKLCELGRLPAVNISASTRPRWAIHRHDLDAFLTPEVQKTSERKTRRQRIDADVKRVFG